MMRFILMLAGLFILSKTALGVHIPEKVQVWGQVVYGRDIFKGAPEHQDIVIAAAPPANETLFLSRKTLEAIAVREWIEWQPEPGFEGVEVRRHVRPVVGALRQQQETEGQSVKLHPQKKEETVLIPVLKAELPKDSLIQAQDIEWMQVSKVQVNSDTIRTKEALVGKVPARSRLQAQTPLKASFVRKPLWVKKGQAVAIRAFNERMDLMMKGIALENGSKGDLIRLKNTTSGKVIYGQVAGERLVEIDLQS